MALGRQQAALIVIGSRLPSSVPGVERTTWCGRRDLNPYVFRHGNLNPARLPVPPRPQKGTLAAAPIFRTVPIFSATYTMYANQLTLVCVTAGRRGLYHAESSART